MPTRNYQSIGEVLVKVKTEFPDITISKIRFLEAEGLIEPERTPSGYRKFYEQDVDRLRSILRMQRDEYLPAEGHQGSAVRDLVRGRRGGGRRRSTDDGESGRRGAARRGADGPADVHRGDVGRDRHRPRPDPRARVLRAGVVARARSARGTTTATTTSCCPSSRISSGTASSLATSRCTSTSRSGRRASSRRSSCPSFGSATPTRARCANASLADLAKASRKLKQALLRTNLRQYLSPSRPGVSGPPRHRLRAGASSRPARALWAPAGPRAAPRRPKGPRRRRSSSRGAAPRPPRSRRCCTRRPPPPSPRRSRALRRPRGPRHGSGAVLTRPRRRATDRERHEDHDRAARASSGQIRRTCHGQRGGRATDGPRDLGARAPQGSGSGSTISCTRSCSSPRATRRSRWPNTSRARWTPSSTLMNERAEQLGMPHTRFTSPNGLDDDGYSSAADLVTPHARGVPDPRVLLDRGRDPLPHDPRPAGRAPRVVQNRNGLLWLYPGATG